MNSAKLHLRMPQMWVTERSYFIDPKLNCQKISAAVY